MTKLAVMTMAANARHSIGQRQDRSKRKPTSAHQEQQRQTRQAKRTRPHLRIEKRRHRSELFARWRFEYARSGQDMCPNLIASSLRTEGEARPHRPLPKAQIGWIVARIRRRARVRNRRFTSLISGRAPSGARPGSGAPGPSCDPGSSLSPLLANRTHCLAPRLAHRPDPPS